jgi:hypothetical protein
MRAGVGLALLFGWVGIIAAGASRPLPAQGPPAPVRIITAVTTKVSIGVYGGACPAKLVFTGTITASAIPKGPVTYQWVRSDKSRSPKRTITMTSTTGTVTEKWQGGRSGEHQRLWEKLQVLTPTAITSTQADVELLCH